MGVAWQLKLIGMNLHLSATSSTELLPPVVRYARKKLFARTTSMKKKIPPTHAALEEYFKRLSSKVQALLPHAVLSSPSSLDWIRTDADLCEPPHWTTLEEASKTCYSMS